MKKEKIELIISIDFEVDKDDHEDEKRWNIYHGFRNSPTRRNGKKIKYIDCFSGELQDLLLKIFEKNRDDIEEIRVEIKNPLLGVAGQSCNLVLENK